MFDLSLTENNPWLVFMPKPYVDFLCDYNGMYQRSLRASVQVMDIMLDLLGD